MATGYYNRANKLTMKQLALLLAMNSIYCRSRLVSVDRAVIDIIA